MKASHWLTISLVALGAATAVTAQPPAATLAEGKRVYDYWCLPCHGTGLGLPGLDALPGTQQLALKYRGTNISPLLEERTDLVPEFVKVVVRQGVSFMPHFRKTEISDAELDALAAYLARNNPPAATPGR
jgi:mono/diheme cytochrome c family protein